jgi:hypothetical protein
LCPALYPAKNWAVSIYAMFVEVSR